MEGERSLLLGQGSKGLEGSCSMGWVQGKGSAKAPFPGLDEVVSMKWSGVSGAGTLLRRWVQGERSLPRVMERRYVPLAPQRAQCPEGATGRGDATGARSGPPCQDGFVLQNTSCGLSKRGHQPRCSVCSTKHALLHYALHPKRFAANPWVHADSRSLDLLSGCNRPVRYCFKDSTRAAMSKAITRYPSVASIITMGRASTLGTMSP